jgi:hypothetical protein
LSLDKAIFQDGRAHQVIDIAGQHGIRQSPVWPVPSQQTLARAVQDGKPASVRVSTVPEIKQAIA